MEQYRENSNQWEKSLSYEQSGQRREFALVHVPGLPPKLVSAIFNKSTYPNEEPLQLIEMSMEEARARYNFLSGLKEAGLF